MQRQGTIQYRDTDYRLYGLLFNRPPQITDHWIHSWVLEVTIRYT